jgi:hypothetical protein
MTRDVAENARHPRPNYYAPVSDEQALAEAARVEGVDDELAELRVRLRSLIRNQPESFELILKGMAMIVRAAGARYRMSAKSKEELADAIGGVIHGVGVQLFPEEELDV